ncbi:MAG: glycosyltransferase [Ignavibacteria bacterium]
MINNIRVAAIIVTHNRLNLLKQCIENVKNQTHKLDEIIVVNNSSNDGTKEWLDNQSDLTVINQENLGSAGGYYTALKYAYEKGHDWFWLLDDDVIPFNNALEKELKYSSISGCINAAKIDKSGKRIPWEGYFDEASGFLFQYDEDEFYNEKDWREVNFGCFEGMLISREVISKIGLPNKEFFIIGDDIFYGYKASKVTNVIYIKDICLRKEILSNQFTDYKIFLYFRNVVGFTYRKVAKKKHIYFLRMIFHYLNHFFKLILKFRIRGIYFMNKGLLCGLLEKFD